MIRRTVAHLRSGSAGIAATEFALIAPVVMMMLMAVLDLAHMSYAHEQLEGAAEQAAREASLETSDTEAADEIVTNAMAPVLPGVAMHTTRKSYFDLADISRPESFNDSNGNNVCDNGESYVDENQSGSWEADIGKDGNGGSGDVVVYTVTATYTSPLHVPFLPQAWAARTITARAVKKNQPFGNQQRYVTQARTCTG